MLLIIFRFFFSFDIAFNRNSILFSLDNFMLSTTISSDVQFPNCFLANVRSSHKNASVSNNIETLSRVADKLYKSLSCSLYYMMYQTTFIQQSNTF